jgi:hypothetical protein
MPATLNRKFHKNELDDSTINKSPTFSDDERNILDTNGEKELCSCELKRN